MGSRAEGDGVGSPGRALEDRTLERLVSWSMPDGAQETTQRLHASNITSEDVLGCPSLRHLLTPRPSPFVPTNYFGGGFVSDDDRVALQSLIFASPKSSGSTAAGLGGVPRTSVDSDQDAALRPLPQYALRSGARETIYYNPKDTVVAVVTCGGLCPGLNDVVRSVVYKALDYGVPESNILGIRFGFRGFYDKAHKPVVLTKEAVESIHLEGGTVLGTSRGGADIREIVKRLDLWKVDVLIVVGGNGGNAGAAAIQAECDRVGVLTSVIAVPKSIDNDILLVDRCFGFDSAVEEAQRPLMAAKVEASSAYRGMGIVKLMGRQSGFIAVQASLASGQVDACLIPEVPFKLDALLTYLEGVLDSQGHVVVCVAEGAGQDQMEAEAAEAARAAGAELAPGTGTDPSGNPILRDVGPWLKSKFKMHFKDADIKLIDPSYLIRSIPATSNDRIYCKMLGHGAVHAAFAGYTGVTIGMCNTHYVILPIPVIIQAPRQVDPHGELWNRLRSAIGQPNFS